MLLRGISLFQGVINDQVEEEIVSSKDSADFATTLEMDEQFLVHKLQLHSKASMSDCNGKVIPSIASHLFELWLRRFRHVRDQKVSLGWLFRLAG